LKEQFLGFLLFASVIFFLYFGNNASHIFVYFFLMSLRNSANMKDKMIHIAAINDITAQIVNPLPTDLYIKMKLSLPHDVVLLA